MTSPLMPSQLKPCWMPDPGCYLRRPDLNSMEVVFSKLQAHLIRSARYVPTFTKISELFSPEECWNYYDAPRYVLDKPPWGWKRLSFITE